MEKITKELVLDVAKNARLELSSKEIELFQKDFKEILSAFDKLSELDVSKVKEQFHATDVKNKFREDIVGEVLGQKALELVKNKEDGYYKGPGV